MKPGSCTWKNFALKYTSFAVHLLRIRLFRIRISNIYLFSFAYLYLLLTRTYMHTRQIDIDTANAHSHNHTRTFTLCPSLFYTRIQFIPANGNLIPLQRIQFVIRVHFWFRYRFPPLQMQNQIGPEPISKFESIHHIQQSIIIIRFRPDYFIFCWHPFVQSIFKLVHSFTRAHARLHAYIELKMKYLPFFDHFCDYRFKSKASAVPARNTHTHTHILYT